MIKITTPSQLAFWRFILTILAVLAFLSAWQMLAVARGLAVQVETSRTWLALLGGLALVAFSGLAGLLSTFIRPDWFERFDIQADGWLRLLAFPVLGIFLAAYPLVLAHPLYGQLIVKEIGVRSFLFWLFALGGTLALRILWRRPDWPVAFAIVLLLQAATHRLAVYLPDITTYPFALGWTETSRFYYPSLFLSKLVYGENLPWPILHPSLHLLLLPPHLFEAPLWFHRAWQVGLRFILMVFVSAALISRFKIESRVLRWFSVLWVFIYLFCLPLYLHLTIPLIIVFWGFRSDNIRRTWVVVLLASMWAGISRLNWYPMPGMLAAVLYLLEMDVPAVGRELQERKINWLSRLILPASWFIVGSLTALATQRIYIILSGVQAQHFYTSLTSDLLWYRLWPNATFWLGIFPGIILLTLPFIIFITLEILQNRSDWHKIQIFLIALALAVLFVGGIIVSVKIGAGADLHNLDAFTVMLLVVAAYVCFRKKLVIPWLAAAVLVLVPVWFTHLATKSFVQFNPARARTTLETIQQRIDSTDGEILFITQRHLISLGMLNGVTLVPEYEREELMELAMAVNREYLGTFASEIENHRFSMIIVDPLKFNRLSKNYSMGEENNIWMRFVVKPVLCFYEQAEAFPEDRIVIYVPRQGEAQCP